MFEDEWSCHCPDLVTGVEDRGEPPLPPDLDSRVEGRKAINRTEPELPIFRVEGASDPSTPKTAISSINTGPPSDLLLENTECARGSVPDTPKAAPNGSSGEVFEL